MPRTRKPTTKKPAAPVEGMIDTTEEVITDESTEKKPPRQRPAGPKKVIGETGKAIADAGAVTLVIAGGKSERWLSFPEAQSITTPATRMIARRLPAFLKKFAPKTKLNPDDAADLEEICLTLGKYALRLAMLIIQDFVAARENQTERQGEKTPVSMPVMPITDELDKDDKERVGVSSNGHNPVFNLIGADFGQGDL